jgi:hypothetical protein
MIPECEPDRISSHRTLHLVAVAATLLIGLELASPSMVVGQSAAPADNGVQVGDRWTFDSRDEITGLPRDTFTRAVTEVSANEIVVRLSFRGKSGFSIIVYDHNWNRIENATVKFKPNDGQGIRPPLAAGKEWRSEFEARNTQTGSSSKDTVVSKIVAQETLMVPAGMYETFKIETRIRELNTANPSRSTEFEYVGWYAPLINFWARRMFVTKVQKRTTESFTEELVDFGRKP